LSGYDVVVVGARCAGSPLAAKLADGGASVLLLDHKPPPADTVSTHFVFPNTAARLAELGALERIERDHRLNPLVNRTSILGHEMVGDYTPVEGFARGFGITRPVLDAALLSCAVDAGAETRFGVRVTGLIRDGGDRVGGVELEGGERIEADRVIGADGRASTVAKALGLEKKRPMAGEFSLLFAYWTAPRDELMSIEAHEDIVVTKGQCEDDKHILVINGGPEFSRGTAEERMQRYLGAFDRFPDTITKEWRDAAEIVSPIVAAPETMLRGFYRQAAGPGWALVGDAGHFKHPATAQGISDAIEQALRVASSLLGDDPELKGYGEWRDARAAEHYEWSFNFAQFPKPETADPVFRGLAEDAKAAQDYRDSWTRQVEPRSGVFTPERLERWFAAAG
jgi:flavin-dependent dehydrogenase